MNQKNSISSSILKIELHTHCFNYCRNCTTISYFLLTNTRHGGHKSVIWTSGVCSWIVAFISLGGRPLASFTQSKCSLWFDRSTCYCRQLRMEFQVGHSHFPSLVTWKHNKAKYGDAELGCSEVAVSSCGFLWQLHGVAQKHIGTL